MTQTARIYYGAFHRKGRPAQSALKLAKWFAIYRPNGRRVALSTSTAIVPAGFWGTIA